jgi:small subunit ribosomal protein S14
MATTAWVVKDKKRRAVKERYFELRQQLKKEGNYAALSRLPRDASPVRVRNRCQLTGRSRGYLRKFSICRNQLRELALKGMIPGLKKASW